MAEKKTRKTDNKMHAPNFTLHQSEVKPKNKGGRPRKFKTKEELWEKFEEYCYLWLKDKRPLTKTGFRAYIRVNHGYMGELPEEFSETVKDISLVCEAYAEEALFTGKNVAGVIFNMINNYKDKWKQRSTQENTGEFNHNIIKVGKNK